MNKQMLKEMALKCKRTGEIASAGAFLLVGIDREAVGMGDCSALTWAGENGKWKMCFLNMVNCEATAEEYVDIITADDLYDDEDNDDFEDFEEQGEAADCRVEYYGRGASVCFHAHANRTNDGLHIKEDFVSMDQGGGSREIPIVYWNTGRSPVKADGVQILPGAYRISLPNDSARVKRRELKREQDEYLEAFIKRCSEEQVRTELDAVTEQIMVLKPDWTEAQARVAAKMFLEQEQGRSA